MSIIITNVKKVTGEKSLYTIKINNNLLCEVEHVQGEGLSKLLSIAAEQVAEIEKRKLSEIIIELRESN